MPRLLFSCLACWLAFVSSSTAPLAAGPLAAAATSIPFEEGEPASVLWDAAARALIIADNEHNQLWTWSDAGGLKKLATLPDPLDAAAAKATLVGQTVRLTDGTLVVMRFGKPGGSSSFGGIAFVNPATGAGGVVPNVDPARKRLGLAVTADGRLFGSYFASMSGGGQAGAGQMGPGQTGPGQTGAVTRIDLKTGEQDFAPGFRKIVGLAVIGDTLYVSDQLADTIYALPLNGPLPAPGAYKVFATLPRPDQLTPGPDGSLFTGQFQAAPGSAQSLAVRQILRDGTVRVVAEDPDVTRPSGVAYDADGHRLFVANGGNPAQRFVRIIPIP